mgnify:CR=1 FL=1
MPPGVGTWGLTSEEAERRPIARREERYYAIGLALAERRTWRKEAVQDRLKAKLAAREAKPKK